MQDVVKKAKAVSHGPIFFLFFVGLMFILTAGAFAQTKIDLNTASEKELESLKGVGPVMAKKIVAARPYSSVDEISKAGLPAKTVEGIKPLVTVGKPATTPPVASKAGKQESPQKAPSTPPTAAALQKAPEKVGDAAPAKLAAGQKVNINSATKEQLEALPGIGPVKAQAVIDGRPYKKADDIMKVKGIKEGTFNKIKDFITVQ